MNKTLSALAFAGLGLPAQAQTYTPGELAIRTIETVNWACLSSMPMCEEGAPASVANI